MTDDDDESRQQLTKNPLGATGEALASNVDRLRNEQNLTFAALSKRLADLGRPIPPLGLRKIVARTRRVDADDLIGLAQALNVSVPTLLMPPATERYAPVAVTGRSDLVAADALWEWLTGYDPLPGQGSWASFLGTAWPEWKHDEIGLETTRRNMKVDLEVTLRRERRALSGEDLGDGDD